MNALRLRLLYGLALALRVLGEMTGDSVCVTSMCVSATCNGTDVEFVLQSLKPDIGWMAIGFGEQMANTPMIIMWPNADGTITLSPREVGERIMPVYDISPGRYAYLSDTSSLNGPRPKLAFTTTVHARNQPNVHLNTRQTFIYASSPSNPNSASLIANITQHEAHGTLVLDLGKPIDSSSNGSPSPPNFSAPWSKFEKLVIAHAVLCGVGFLVFLPIGALLARYARTLTTGWFAGHWIGQFALAGSFIVIGIALGIQAVVEANGVHLNSLHKKTGVALAVLYVMQCGLGALIHFVKPVSRRPPQNYVHAVLGLLLIGLAFWQVRTGYHLEWPRVTGRGSAPNGVNVAWIVWVVLVPVLYMAGLAFLPRQFNKEKAGRRRQSEWAMQEYK